MQASAKILAKFATALIILTTSVVAQPVTYTNSSDFFNAISSSNYTENYNSFPYQASPVPPQNFSSNGFSYTALITNGNFYMINNADRWLSTFDVTPIVFTNFSVNVTALGGNFFATDFFEAYTNTSISLSFLFADSTTFSTNYLPGSPSSYFGLIYTTNIASLTISNVPPAAEFMTVNNLTVAVPEPSTYALLGLAAAGLAGYVIRRRRS